MNSLVQNSGQSVRWALRYALSGIARRLPANTRGRIRAGRALDRLLGGSGYRRWRENVLCHDGVRMILDTDEAQQKQLYWTGSYDRLAIQALVEHLPDHGIFIDIGAGVGSICLFALQACRRSGRNISVHAFEPLALNHARLLENACLNSLQDAMFCHRLALGASKGSVELCYRDGAGSAAVVRSGADISTVAGSQWECVPCDTLDDWAAANNLTRLDVIKIDIEGAEPLMFRGAMRTIEKFHPVILGEFNHWWAERHGLSISADCFGPLWDMGYEAFRLNPLRGAWARVSGRPAPGPDMEDTLWIPPPRDR